ncbi:MAG: hypothetical protein AAFN78_07575 [Pseudomonadota bacterium]
MPKSHAERLRAILAESARLRRIQIDSHGLTDAQRSLSAWQSQRLARTYRDLSDTPRFSAAVQFFLSDLYGDRDFSQRDSDIERVYPLMIKVLSEPAIASLTVAFELHTLSQSLDTRMLDVLTRDLGVKLDGTAEAFTAAQYGEAYRLCDNSRERKRQIELVLEAGELLDSVVRKPMIYTTVKLARKPARIAGFGELQDFIERGFSAFRRMKDATPFLTAVKERETAISEAIFAGQPPEEWLEAGHS